IRNALCLKAMRGAPSAQPEISMSRVRELVLACVVASSCFAGALEAAQQNSGAIGQIVPSGGVIALTGEPGAIVSSIRGHPGDMVTSGDLLMTLQGDALKAEQDLA